MSGITPLSYGLCRPTRYGGKTAEALKKPAHPYRAAIDDAFEGRVSVFDISEIAQIRPQDLTERVCMIVTTFQTLRTSNTDGRNAYAHSENFEPHFAHVPENAEGLERGADGRPSSFLSSILWLFTAPF